MISDTATVFIKKKHKINSKILTPKHHDDFNDKIINKIEKLKKNKILLDFNPRKGDEISSSNYIDEGIPFIKTSGFSNFGVDTQSNHYCSEDVFNEKNQQLNVGDIIFTKDGKIGEVGIIDETNKVVLSAGIVIIRANYPELRYWIFLLLNSAYGKIMFKKWNVIASTMSHLRKDLYQDFLVPNISNELKEKYVLKMMKYFDQKLNAHKNINLNKPKVLNLLN